MAASGVARRYRLAEPLGTGGMGVVYHAIDALTGRDVAIKWVRGPRRAAPDCAETAAPDWAAELSLAREFEAQANLRHPNVAEVYDFGFEAEGRPFLAIELLAGAVPITRAASGLPFDARIELLAQLLRALAYLHAHGLIHRDLKPNNVLIHGGRVKLIDFGLALERKDDADVEAAAAPTGTPGYIAPELSLGLPATVRSDLFAVGVIAYEVLVGRHPFPDGAYRAPDLTPLPHALGRVISRLLARDWRERFADAAAALSALGDATGVAAPLLTEETAESHLTAAPLVGREPELAVLSSALDDLDDRRGSAFLITGESGVGKSRLAHELRIRALVSGAIVVRGRAISEDGAPYQPWLDVLRHLTLLVEPTPEEGRELRRLLPDLEAPREPSSAAPPDVASAVESLLDRLPAPVVLVLEDLHWARAESLALLDRVSAEAARWPLLVVATARDDAAQIVGARSPAMKRLELRRLPPPAIASLAERMLGPLGRDPEVLETLERESEGNPLLLIEWARVLLRATDSVAELPHGAKAIFERRLAQVPPELLPLLRLSAVAGRRIDRELLASIDPNHLDTKLLALAELRVLDVDGGGYHFSHDRLRDAVLGSVAESDVRALHARLARAKEQRPDRESAEAVAAIAYHWVASGERAPARVWSIRAAEQALAASAYEQAATWFDRALALTPSDAANRAERARLMRCIADAALRPGRHADAIAWSSRSLRELGSPVPAKTHRLLIDTAIDLAALASKRSGLPPASAETQAELLRAQIVLNEASFFQDDPAAVIWGLIRGLRLSTDSAPFEARARARSGAGVLLGFVGLHQVAERLLRQSVDLAGRSSDRYTQAVCVHRRALVQLIRGEWAHATAGLESARASAERAGDRRQWLESTLVRGLLHAYSGQLATAATELERAWSLAKKNRDVDAELWGAQFLGYAWLRLDRLDAAFELLEACVHTAGGRAPVDRFNALAPLAMAALRRDDRARALRLAFEALDALGRAGIPVYWAHHSIGCLAETLLTLAETEEDAAQRASLLDATARAAKAARSFARMVPIARASAELWSGWHARLIGRRKSADRSWRRGLDQADRRTQEIERAQIELEVGRTAEGSAGAARLEAAAQRFGRLGLAFEQRRTLSLLSARRRA